MSVTHLTNKRVVVVFWKERLEQPFEVFSNLKNFCLSYPQYSYNTLNNYLSKGKIPFENREVRVERKNIITQPKAISSSIKTRRMIVPVVRKVAFNEANDTARDLEYWLKQPYSKRIEAVTFIIAQSLRKGAKIDRTAVRRKALRS